MTFQGYGSSCSRSRPGRLAKSAAALSLASVLVALCAHPAGAAPAVKLPGPTTGPARFVGWLPLPADRDPSEAPIIASVEGPGRTLRAFYASKKTSSWHLTTYDISKGLPRLVHNVDMGSGFDTAAASPLLNSLDRGRRRLLSLRSGFGSRVVAIDLDRGRITAEWDLQQRVPGFIGWGLTYSEEDDRVYVVGETILNDALQNGPLFAKGSRPPAPTVLLALEPDGALAWAINLPHCEPMNTWTVGTLLARSLFQNALYIPCLHSFVYPNLSGILRVKIAPHGTQADALEFGQEFFPVSGTYLSTGGVVTAIPSFDPGTDRIFMLSVSYTTPGAWVFDGRRSGWVGFIASPDPQDSVGVNPGTGHYYMCCADKSLTISPARGTPVPQGVAVPGVEIQGFIYADPSGNHIYAQAFVRPNVVNYAIFEDGVPDEQELAPTRYDALTQQIAEGPETYVTYSGGARAFGARIGYVGGYGGTLAGPYTLVIPSGSPRLPGIGPGDRGFTFANVPSLDLRQVGSSATAQALSPDSNTEEEHRTRQRELGEKCHATAEDVRNSAGEDYGDAVETQCPSVDPTLQSTSASAAWPWRPLGCLDAEGQKIHDDADGAAGHAEITCDLNEQSAHSVTSFGAFSADGVSVGSVAVDAKASRSKTEGAVTEITAAARTVEITGPDGSTVSIGVIRSVVRALAHGRNTSAHIDYHRFLEKVIIRDKKGRETQKVDACADHECDPVLTAMNLALGPRVRVYQPAEAQRQTPGGAFAGVEKSDVEYYNALTVQNDDSRAVPGLEVLFFNDSSEKSRLVLQFAAVEASSIYTISRAEDVFPPDIIPPAPIPELPGIPPQPAPVGPAPQPPRPESPIVQAVGLPGSFVLLVRSPEEAFHMALTLLLFIGAVAIIVRRRALRRLLAS